MLSLVRPASLVWLVIAFVVQALVALSTYLYLVPALEVQFANPDALAYLALVPLCELAVLGYALWRRAAHLRLGEGAMIEEMTRSRSGRRQVARAALLIAALTLLVLALSQPQWGRIERPVKRTGVDVVFALDLSSSMLARDVAPDRLQAAKQEITTTLELLGGDRVGLVVFTAVSFAQSPLTTDYGALRFYLRKLRPGQMPVGGTSVGLALDDSIELLTGKQDDPEDGSVGDPVAPSQRAKTQVVVLITDGEDHESDPVGVAKKAKEQGIHVVTVGFGSSQGSRIPIMRDDGTLAGYKRDPDGEIVYTRLDDTTLRQISTLTGGVYVPYAGKNSVANALIRYINTLEKSELETLLRQRYQDRFMWFLFPGVLLLLAAMFLGERARTRRISVAASLVALALASTGCQEAFRGEVDAVAEGNAAVSEQRFDDALVSYERAQSAIPTTPELHFDMGVAHLGAGEHELAREAFARAMETDDPTLHFDALHNLGLALAGEEKWREAYETYQSALSRWALDPELLGDARRAAAARNLEVVFQKLYPPCLALEDDLEDNDTAQTASTPDDLTQITDRTLCGLDEDWYAIPALPGAQVTISATFKTLRDEPDPERAFLPNPEDLQIALFDGKGDKVVSIDQGFADADDDALMKSRMRPQGARKGKKQTVTRAIPTVLVTEEMLQGSGRLHLKVSAADELEFAYDLDVDTVPPCSALEDEHEDNDTMKEAATLTAGAHQLHTCSGDLDWFAVEVELGDTLFVDLQAAPADEDTPAPQLTLELRGPDGKLLQTGAPESGLLTAGLWDVAQPGTYYVRVAGVDDAQEGPYNLELFQYAPCPAGDDRLEDNDSADSAHELDPQAPMHRYLRLCPGDADYYAIALEPTNPPEKDDAKKSPAIPNPMAAPPKKDGADAEKEEGPWRLALGLSVVRQPGAPDPLAEPEEAAPAQDDDLRAVIDPFATDDGPFDDPLTAPLAFDLLSPSGDQILLSAIPPAPADPAADTRDAAKAPGDDGAEEEDAAQNPIALDRILQSDELAAPRALVRVQGRPLFYHLVQLDPPPSQQDQQQDEQQEDQQEDQQQESGDENEDDGESGNDGEQDDQKPEDGEEQKDEGKQGEDGEPKDDEKPEESEGKPEDEEEKEEPTSPAEQAQEDPEAQRIEDILRALEDTDDNFQMRKALKNAPRRYIQKDW